jgi:poly(A) polymerase
VLRLFVLAKSPLALKEHLRLSNSEGARLQNLADAPELSPALTDFERRRLLYHLGASVWRDAVRLSWAQSRAKMDDGPWQALLDLSAHWAAPVFPVKGSDLLAAGVAAGPQMGRVLAKLEDWWVASDFAPTKDDLLARVGRYKE